MDAEQPVANKFGAAYKKAWRDAHREQAIECQRKCRERSLEFERMGKVAAAWGFENFQQLDDYLGNIAKGIVAKQTTA